MELTNQVPLPFCLKAGDYIVLGDWHCKVINRNKNGLEIGARDGSGQPWFYNIKWLTDLVTQGRLKMDHPPLAKNGELLKVGDVLIHPKHGGRSEITAIDHEKVNYTYTSDGCAAAKTSVPIDRFHDIFHDNYLATGTFVDLRDVDESEEIQDPPLVRSLREFGKSFGQNAPVFEINLDYRYVFVVFNHRDNVLMAPHTTVLYDESNRPMTIFAKKDDVTAEDIVIARIIWQHDAEHGPITHIGELGLEKFVWIDTMNVGIQEATAANMTAYRVIREQRGDDATLFPVSSQAWVYACYRDHMLGPELVLAHHEMDRLISQGRVYVDYVTQAMHENKYHRARTTVSTVVEQQRKLYVPRYVTMLDIWPGLYHLERSYLVNGAVTFQFSRRDKTISLREEVLIAAFAHNMIMVEGAELTLIESAAHKVTQEVLDR